MSLKLFGLLAPLALGGLWVGGAIGGAAYSRDVDRTPAQVMTALGDLDIREQPGEPGTDASRSGGVTPLFRTERGTNQISFVVMSGNQVATRMTALLEPLDGGRRTRVTARVERGDAPDDFVSPAFRSAGITMGLFATAIEGELDELVAPPRLSRERCQELEVELLEANAPAGAGAGPDDRPGRLKRAVGSTARTVITLHAVQAELRRRGCPAGGGGGGSGFTPVEDRMGEGGRSGQPNNANFQPGRPMVDVSRDRSRHR